MSKDYSCTAKELVKFLLPYFDAGILTDIIYVSDVFCVFNYADLDYVLCLNNNIPSSNYAPTALGFIIHLDDLKDYIEEPLFAVEVLKEILNTNPKSAAHFNELNLKHHLNHLNENRDSIKPRCLDSQTEKEFKTTYNTPDCESFLNEARNLTDPGTFVTPEIKPDSPVPIPLFGLPLFLSSFWIFLLGAICIFYIVLAVCSLLIQKFF